VSEQHLDEHTGLATTGHEWDGIKELNRPLPRWWVWVFYACVLYAVGYWVVYPAWPMLHGYTPGIWGYSQRQTVNSDVASARVAQGKFYDAVSKSDLATVQASPELLSFANSGGRILFANNCAPCHGRGAQGGVGYPNLSDDDWLWGGKLEDISTTITHGIRAGDSATRQSQMPRFGLDKLLEPAQIDDLAEFVLSLSGGSKDAAAAGRGKQLFADNCVACHGDDGKGKHEVGAPNLTDKIWLYGGAKQDVVHSIETGRGGVMPNWGGRLDPVSIKMLAIYVHSLGGGQ